MRDRTKSRIKVIYILAIIIFSITMISLAAHLRGYELSLKVEKDSYISEVFPDNNYGADDYMRVGNYNFGKVQAFYYFNISSLPDGWTEAKIMVNFDYGSDMVDVGANLTYESWDEMTITWNNKPSESVYRGHILCDGFNTWMSLRPDQIINGGVGVFLYGRGGEEDGYIQGTSKERASSSSERAWIELSYVGINPIILTGLGIAVLVICFLVGAVVVSVKMFKPDQKPKKVVKDFDRFVKAKAFNANWFPANIYETSKVVSLEKKINQYITIKLVNRRTYIYVNGRRFIQCIRLILNIPKRDVPLYDEIDSIDEAAKLYSTHVFQNRMVRGPMAAPVPNQMHDITPEQEFWGHSSNIQAWIEHSYDTRILMSNISFPLLRELAKAGDPTASKVFKEEIALRLESGYPSVVQYLINQGYLGHFNTFEFKTIIESTEIIKNLSSDPKMLSRFLIFCSYKFSTLLEEILLQILKLPVGKNIIISSMSMPERHRMFLIRSYLRPNPGYFFKLKVALDKLFREVDPKIGEDIIDIIQKIEIKLEEQKNELPNTLSKSRWEDYMKKYLELMALQNFEKEKILPNAEKLLGKVHKTQSKCSYCGKIIPRGQDTCDWCGHKRDDEGGFFPYPYIFKPPGGGGGSMKEAQVVSVKVWAQA